MDKYNKYDSLIRYYAEKYKLSWMVVKAQLIAESSMNPNAISPVGAKGLGQFMPSTWEEWGKGDPFNPEESIKACCKYMNFLYSKFGEIPNPQERYKFALASYNAGRGNINNVLEFARQGCELPAKYSEWFKLGKPSGEWQKWDYAKAFLYLVTGKNSEETINYIDRIME